MLEYFFIRHFVDILYKLWSITMTLCWYSLNQPLYVPFSETKLALCHARPQASLISLALL